MLDDAGKGYNPGYSFHGRMFALAQMDGVIATVKDEISKRIIQKQYSI
jgi:mannonate dehydratase